MPEMAAMDLFVVPTFAFKLLNGFIIVRLDRRELVWIAVTNSPTADWIARQITKAFPWESAPRNLIREGDCDFGSVVRQRLRAMAFGDKPTSIAVAERFRRTTDWVHSPRMPGPHRHFSEAHLRHLLRAYASYYNASRTHQSLDKGAPVHRPVQLMGGLKSRPILGGLHHQYVRI